MWIAGRYLQRSHALSGVETEMGATLPTDNIDLQRSHALSGVETSVIISASSMNSNRLQRSHALSGVETVSELQCRYRPCGPSTKPRPFRRGDRKCWQNSNACSILQRSHALSGVETAGLSARRAIGVFFESPLLGTPKT